METYISSKTELHDLIESAVDKAIQKNLPTAIQKASRKKWLTTAEVMQLLQCSRPHVLHLRTTNQIPFRQNGRKILYSIDEIEGFLNRGKVNSFSKT